MKTLIQKLIPAPLYQKILHPYHWIMALLGALVYRFPSKKLFVIGVTGTKGKSSTAELINAILERAGYKTALSGTIRFKIGDAHFPNKYKMTMPGRFFLQHFLHEAASNHCDYAIVEMTSEGVTQFRHKWIALDMLIFTNIAPEHIEAHGSFENYLAAKLELRELLRRSPKLEKWAIANVDDEYGEDFLEVPGAHQIGYSLSDAEPYTTNKRGVLLTYKGESLFCPLLGTFNIYNVLAAIAVGESQKVDLLTIKKALEDFGVIPGRAEVIDAGQSYTVVVDYAHTPDSLEALYAAFSESHKGARRICVLGNTGGGRDRWKRPVMGEIADRYCSSIILTNEDPYDENPHTIVEEMARGVKKHTPSIVMDRREAIREALTRARRNDVVLITGKGTDPYIMGPRGTKVPWSDKRVVEAEIKQLLHEQERKRRKSSSKKSAKIV